MKTGAGVKPDENRIRSKTSSSVPKQESNQMKQEQESDQLKTGSEVKSAPL